MFTGSMPQAGGNTGFAIAYTIKMLIKNGLNVCLLPLNLNSRVIFDCILFGLICGRKEYWKPEKHKKIIETPMEKDVFLKQSVIKYMK